MYICARALMRAKEPSDGQRFSAVWFATLDPRLYPVFTLRDLRIRTLEFFFTYLNFSQCEATIFLSSSAKKKKKKKK